MQFLSMKVSKYLRLIIYMYIMANKEIVLSLVSSRLIVLVPTEGGSTYPGSRCISGSSGGGTLRKRPNTLKGPGS